MQAEVLGYGISCVDYMAVVDKIPEIDETTIMVDFSKQMGGPVAVAMAAFSNLGGRASYAGGIGKDENGRIIKETLNMFKVDIRPVIERKSFVSPFSFVLIEKKSGKRTIIFNPGCTSSIRFSEFDISYFRNVKFLHLEGFLTEEAIKAADWAHTNNIAVVLDAGFYLPRMDALLKKSDIVVASKDFTVELGGSSVLKEGVKKIKKIAPDTNLIVATGGEEGSVCLYENNFFYQPAFKIKPIDTTGAGDVFHGAFLFGLVKNWGIQKVLEFSSAAAAFKCTRQGGIKGIPDYDEVVNFIKKLTSSYHG